MSYGTDASTVATAGGRQGTLRPAGQLTLGCSTSRTGETRLTLAGELDIASADQAYCYVRDAIDRYGGAVLLDVAGLSFCDAAGLRALARMSSHARQAGSLLQLDGPRPMLARIIRITGLAARLPVRSATEACWEPCPVCARAAAMAGN